MFIIRHPNLGFRLKILLIFLFIDMWTGWVCNAHKYFFDKKNGLVDWRVLLKRVLLLQSVMYECACLQTWNVLMFTKFLHCANKGIGKEGTTISFFYVNRCATTFHKFILLIPFLRIAIIVITIFMQKKNICIVFLSTKLLVDSNEWWGECTPAMRNLHKFVEATSDDVAINKKKVICKTQLEVVQFPKNIFITISTTTVFMITEKSDIFLPTDEWQ